MGFTESVTQASSGAVAAIVTTVALYPLDLIKTRLNNGVDEGGVPYAGPLDVLQREYRKKGSRPTRRHPAPQIDCVFLLFLVQSGRNPSADQYK
ncbi:hypothetical protein T484DRAFT_3435471 [Baffinella frigidus]|nr:hypothetical protein T484DRAFT_3435471 [Cryptophyta sp. CCMP2293]